MLLEKSRPEGGCPASLKGIPKLQGPTSGSDLESLELGRNTHVWQDMKRYWLLPAQNTASCMTVGAE